MVVQQAWPPRRALAARSAKYVDGLSGGTGLVPKVGRSACALVETPRGRERPSILAQTLASPQNGPRARVDLRGVAISGRDRPNLRAFGRLGPDFS